MAKEVQTESHLRSILKAFSWRIVATSTIIAIAYFTIGDISIALEIGFIEFFIKMLLYYLHERAWQMAPRGSIRQMFGKEKDEAKAQESIPEDTSSLQYSKATKPQSK